MHSIKLASRRALVVGIVVVALFVAAPVFSAIVLRASVPTGSSPSAIALNPVTHRLYAANYFGGTTSVIDGQTESGLATLSAGTGLTIPNAVVVNSVSTPPRAYVANFWAGSFNVIDETSLTVAGTVFVGARHGVGSPRALALDPSGATPKLYVAEYGMNSVSVWNAETYAFIKRIPVGTAPRALGIFSSAPRRRIYVANRGSNTVSVIDGDTDTVIATLACGSAPKAIAIDASTGWAWVTNELGNSVTAIDASDTVAGTVAVGVRPTGIAVDSGAGRVFVANYTSNSVSVIKTSDLTTEATLAVGIGPWAVGVDATDSKTYVSCYAADTVAVIDGALSVSQIGVGDGPYAFAIDENTTPHKVFVANRNGNSISVLGEDGLGSRFVPGIASAYAAGAPVVGVTVDTVTETDGTTVIEGTARSTRRFPAALLRLWLRVDEAAWVEATIIEGAGTPVVRWRAAVAAAGDGTHTLSVRVLDQTAAASSSSDGAGSDKAASLGVNATLSFSAGPVLAPKRGAACASCHGTPARGNRQRPLPTPLDRCPQTR